jgi:hypothetical protein
MILRRVIAHFRKQEWTAIAIDFVIVVVGVFVGLQVNNWNTDQSNQKREAGILREIRADLLQDRQEIATGRELALIRISAANYTLEKMGKKVAVVRFPQIDNAIMRIAYDSPVPDSPPPDDRTRGALWAVVVSYYFPTPSTTALDTLLSSGGPGLIRDESIVRELQNYRLVLSGLAETHTGTLRPLRNDALRVGNAYGLASFGEIAETDFLKLVSENLELAATVESQLDWTVMHIALLDSVDERAATLLERLEQDIAKSSCASQPNA